MELKQEIFKMAILVIMYFSGYAACTLYEIGGKWIAILIDCLCLFICYWIFDKIIWKNKR